MEKHDPRIAEVKHWINDVYEVGRTEVISNAEIEQQMRKSFSTGIHQFSLVK